MPVSAQDVFTVILGGGQGARLFPLTKERAKPAVPLAGKYRLVDIPISNCINSGLHRICLLTQFKSASLHRHISQSYTFDHFSSGFVELLAAEQTLTNVSWYEGTADAVRKNLVHILSNAFDYLLILSGDQLYRMDYRTILDHHVARGADVTVGMIPVTRKDVPGFGIMEVTEDLRIHRFVEKPQDPATQDTLRLQRDWHPKLGLSGQEDYFLASMGIYVFSREPLLRLLNNDRDDFGRHIIPLAIESHRVFAHVFQGYWEDIGTIRAFFEANIELTSPQARFDFFNMNAPVFTRPRYLPASKINGTQIDKALVSDGCILNRARVRQTLLGIRSIVDEGSDLVRTVMMGSDYYESMESIQRHAAQGRPRMGVGRNTRIENAIIDKNARIGSNCVVTPAGKPETMDDPLFYIRDGIILIPKNGCIPDGTIV